MATQPPEFLRIGPIVYTRREFGKRLVIFGLGVLGGVGGTLLIQDLANTRQLAQEVVPTSEIVRGSLLGAFDETGKLITNSLVPGSHLIMVVREVPAPNFAVRSVQAMGAFKDFQDPWPQVGEVEQPNFGSNYLVVANLDALQGGVPKNSPFQVNYSVNFAGPDGQTGTKLNDPGPLQFTRI